MGGFIVALIVIAIIVLIVRNIATSDFWDWNWVDIPCDAHCGNMCGIRKREYKKKEHKAGLVKYFCRSCRAAGRH